MECTYFSQFNVLVSEISCDVVQDKFRLSQYFGLTYCYEIATMIEKSGLIVVGCKQTQLYTVSVKYITVLYFNSSLQGAWSRNFLHASHVL